MEPTLQLHGFSVKNHILFNDVAIYFFNIPGIELIVMTMNSDHLRKSKYVTLYSSIIFVNKLQEYLNIIFFFDRENYILTDETYFIN